MRVICLGFALALIAPIAHAEPGLSAEVYGPNVRRGQVELEARSGVLNGGPGGGEWSVVGEAAYGVTDWWRPAALFEVEREAGGEARLEAVGFENVFDFTATREWPVHFGAYAEYEANLQDDPHKIELKLLAERTSGPLRLRLNLIGEREVGSGSDNQWEFGYAAQGLWSLNDDVAVGVEGFGDAGTDSEFGRFGDHAHYWGPVAQFEAFENDRGELEVGLGYLFGSADAEADGQFRLSLEWER